MWSPPRRVFSIGVPLFAAFVACATFVPALFGMGGRAQPNDTVLFTGLTTLFLLAFLPLFRKRLGEPVFGTVAGILLGFSFAVLRAAARSWHAPFLFGMWRCGTNDAFFLLLSPLIVGLPIAAGGWVGGWITRAGRTRAWVARATMGLIALQVVGLVGGVAARWGTAPYDDVEAWLADDAEATRFDFSVAEQAETTSRVIGDGARLERRCERRDHGGATSRSCFVRLRPIGAQAACEPNDVSPACPAEGRLSFEPDDALVVRHDSRTGIWLVGDDERVRLAFGEDLAPRDVRRSDLRGLIPTPSATRVLALAGFLLCLVPLWLRRRTLLRRDAVTRGRVGHSDGVEVHFDDAELPARAPLSRATAAGPVVVCSARRPLAGYRDAGSIGPHQVYEGLRSEVTERLSTRALGLLLLAYAALVVTSAPFLVM